MTHTKQLLLVTFCNTTEGIRANFRTHAQTADGGRTERRGSRNSYLDVECSKNLHSFCLEVGREFSSC